MGCKRVLLMQRYDIYLSCARVWGEKLCKAREKSINLFNCFSEISCQREKYDVGTIISECSRDSTKLTAANFM